MDPNTLKLKKLFGSGPLGLLISIFLFLATLWLSRRIDFPAISGRRTVLNAVFMLSILIAIFIIVWSFRSLPPSERGNQLCINGAFRYLRHPLYAAFLSSFNFGLAFYLNNYLFLLWALLLHPLWHYVVRSEEKFMLEIFKDEYKEYQKKTGCFFLRWTIH
jgi:protein-S-isoprenylcysteine O-methyltransferase Ste14